MSFTLDLRWRLAAFTLWTLAGSLTETVPGAMAFCLASLSFAVLVPWRVLAARVAAVGPFLLLIIVPLLLAGAFQSAGQVALKAGGMLLSGLGFMTGARQREVLAAARGLGVPAALLHLVVIAERYAFVLMDEWAKLRLAGRVRGFRAGSSAASLRATGKALGALTVRAVDRGERVGQALACRGGGAQFRTRSENRASRWDVGLLVLVSAMAAALLIWDRWGRT